MPDPEGRVTLFSRGAVVGQPVEHGRQVAGADVARPQARRHGAHTRDQLAFGSVVVERRLDLAGQRVVVGGRFVRPLDHRDHARAADRRPECVRRERPEARHGDRANGAAEPAEVIDDRGGRVGHRAHRDDDLGGALAAVRLHGGIAAAGEARPVLERGVQLARQPVVERSLAEAALHVAVLVLDDAGHQRPLRVEPRAKVIPWVADELAQEIVLRQHHRLERVRGQEPVLDDEEGHLGHLGDASGDRRRGRRPPGRCVRTGSPTPCRRRP